MLDRYLRSRAERVLGGAAHLLDRLGISALAVTLVGFGLGVGACVAMAVGLRAVALGLFVLNRLADGLDGMVARINGATDRGGFLDIMADFGVYAGFVVGTAIARPGARLAAVVLLGAYYVSAVALLAWSSLAERRARSRPDNRSLHFAPGLAEGAETIIVYCILCLWPTATETTLWVFASMVGVTALQRVRFAWRSLSVQSG